MGRIFALQVSNRHHLQIGNLVEKGRECLHNYQRETAKAGLFGGSKLPT